MLTRHFREMERQADVVTVREPQRYVVAELPVGSYMWRYIILTYLYHNMNRPDLAKMIENRCDVYESNGGIDYLQTSQLQILLDVKILREMECEIPTLSILSK
jgi:hypothetical protein